MLQILNSNGIIYCFLIYMSVVKELPTKEGLTPRRMGRIMQQYGLAGLSYSLRKSDFSEVALVETARRPIVVKRPIVPERSIAVTRQLVAEYEVGVLDLLLDHLDTAPLAVPIMVDHDYQAGIFVAEYVPGISLTDDKVERMNNQEKILLGKKLAQFVVWESNTLQIDDPKFQKLSTSSGRPYDKRHAFMANKLGIEDDLDYIGQHELASTAAQLSLEYANLIKAGLITKRDMVGHNDLKPSNLIFGHDQNGNLELTGVIDFGGAVATTAEQELRRTVLLGDTVLYAAIEEYKQLTGITLNESVIRFWAKVHFADFAFNVAKGNASRDNIPFLLNRLIRLFPGFDGRELTGEIKYHYSK